MSTFFFAGVHSSCLKYHVKSKWGCDCVSPSPSRPMPPLPTIGWRRSPRSSAPSPESEPVTGTEPMQVHGVWHSGTRLSPPCEATSGGQLWRPSPRRSLGGASADPVGSHCDRGPRAQLQSAKTYSGSKGFTPKRVGTKMKPEWLPFCDLPRQRERRPRGARGAGAGSHSSVPTP